MPPVISIGLPVYNGEAFLEAAVDSLLRQTHRDFELTICDNCSTDRTESICRKFAEQDARVRYVRNDRNIGAAANFNKTVELAQGRYFAWANHDDLWEGDYLKECLAAMEANPGAMLAYAQSMMIDAEGKPIMLLKCHLGLDGKTASKRLWQLHRHGLELDARRAWHEQSAEGLWIPVYGLMDREKLARSGMVGSYISSDTVLIEELLMLGPFLEIDKVLFYKRDHQKRSTRECESYDKRIEWFSGRKNNGRLLFPSWRILGGRLAAIGRTSLPLGERVRCYWEIATYYVRCRHEGGKALIKEVLYNSGRLVGGLMASRAVANR